MHITRPNADEYSTYHLPYLAQIPDGTDPLMMLRQHPVQLRELLGTLTEQQALFRYAPGKWSLKESLVHLIDTERIFAYRALRIARGDQTPLPGFEQADYVPYTDADSRPLDSIGAEYEGVRAATLLLFESFSDAALTRRGIVNGNPISVRALICILAGHEAHHLQLLRGYYLV